MSIISLIGRYSFSRYNRHRISSIRIALSYAFSMAILMLILSVMQMLQTSRFSLIRDIKSFDILIEDGNEEEIRDLYPECSVFSYKEGYALLNGSPFSIRYVDENYDGGINMLFGSMGSLVIPYSLYATLSELEIDFSSLSRTSSRSTPVNIEMVPSGVYHTALSAEFDSTHAFLPYDSALGNEISYVAVKGSDDVSPLAENGIGNFRTWKESESTLYSAFTLENFMMFAVLMILLVIVYVELYSEARVFLRNKRKERLELEIMGLGKREAQGVFIASFLLVILSASLLSVLLQEIFLRAFSSIMRRGFSMFMTLKIDYGLFVILNIAFLMLTAITVYVMLIREDRKSMMEVING